MLVLELTSSLTLLPNVGFREVIVGKSDYDKSLFTLIFANYFYLSGIVPTLKYLKREIDYFLNFKEKQHSMFVARTIQGMTWRDFNIPYLLIFISFPQVTLSKYAP